MNIKYFYFKLDVFLSILKKQSNYLDVRSLFFVNFTLLLKNRFPIFTPENIFNRVSY